MIEYPFDLDEKNTLQNLSDDLDDLLASITPCITDVGWNNQGLAEICVAGGFLRDMYLGVRPKDIDIFVVGHKHIGEHSVHLSRKKFVEANFFDVKEIDTNLIYPVSEGAEMCGVIELEPERLKNLRMKLPIQIIFVRWQGDILERFDFGNCKIKKLHGGPVIQHPHFIEDVTDRKFRVRRERTHWALDATVERYARIKPRYPDRSFESYESYAGQSISF